MDKNTVIIGVLGFILGILLMLVVNSNRPMGEHMEAEENKEMISNNSMMHGAMGMMMNSLDGKTGEEFDKAFLSEMIVHHQGAVDMAEAAATSASHQEIKDMSQAIIDAQTKEIDQMKQWQKEWGYDK